MSTKLSEHEKQLSELYSKIDQLQETIVFTTEQAENKQELLRREIDGLLKQLNIADSQRQDTISTLPDATIPLLQQIDLIEKASARKEEQWKDIEQKLNYKVKIAENNLSLSKMEQNRMQSIIEQQKVTISQLQSQINHINQELLSANQSVQRIELQLNEKDLLLHPLQRDNLLMKSEIEQLQSLLGESRREIESLYQSLEKQNDFNKQNGECSEKPQPEQEQIVTVVAVTEEQSDKQQFTKVQMLMKRVEELEELKDKLTNDVITLTNTNKKLTKQIEDQEELKREYNETCKKLEAAFEIIGEKEETINDMQQDLKYVKDKFRIQIMNLFEEIDELKRKLKDSGG